MTEAMKKSYYSTHLIELVEQREVLTEALLKESHINSRDKQGRTALYWAIKNHSKHNVNLLLKNEIGLKVSFSKHALFHAMECNNTEALFQILESGANINLQDEKGRSLLMVALKAENIMMVQLLISKGIDLYIMDENHDMALDYAKKCKNKNVHDIVYYKALNDSAKEEQQDCTGCGFGQQSLCAIQEKI